MQHLKGKNISGKNVPYFVLFHLLQTMHIRCQPKQVFATFFNVPLKLSTYLIHCFSAEVRDVVAQMEYHAATSRTLQGSIITNSCWIRIIVILQGRTQRRCWGRSLYDSRTHFELSDALETRRCSKYNERSFCSPLKRDPCRRLWLSRCVSGSFSPHTCLSGLLSWFS